MIRISVKSTEVRNQKGAAKATGKPYNMDFQEAYAYTVDRNGVINPFPEKIELTLEHDANGAALFYPVGDYVPSQSSYYVGDFKRLSFNCRLQPVKADPKPAV